MGCGKSRAESPHDRHGEAQSRTDPFAKYEELTQLERTTKVSDDDVVAYFNADEFVDFDYKPNWKESVPQPTDALIYSDRFPGSCRLEYVYGYRCEASRQHVHLTSDSRVAYPAGGTLVLLERRTLAQEHIGGFLLKLKTDPECPLTHSDEILAVACHPQRSILASSQTDGQIFIWSIEDLELPLSVFEASDTVRLMSFSCEGRWLAVVTLKALQVWDWDNCCVIATKAHDALADIAWVPNDDLMYSAGKHTL
jgi:hypothetical protein